MVETLMDYEIDDFYVGPPLRYIDSEKESLKKFINEYAIDEQKFMLIEIEEYDD
jgi:hypothetical protein